MAALERIIVLAPHPDDGEFACGASLKRWREEGIEIHYIVFSPCNKSLPPGFEADALFHECRRALKHLDIGEEMIRTYNFPVREFPTYRQEILEELIKLKFEIQPDLVLMPASTDIHQDHHQIYQEGVRAFKHSRLLGYELMWNLLEFRSNFHVVVQPEHLNAKLKALKEYESQTFRVYTDADFLTGLARTRGIQVQSAFAEAFEVIRWIY